MSTFNISPCRVPISPWSLPISFSATRAGWSCFLASSSHEASTHSQQIATTNIAPPTPYLRTNLLEDKGLYFLTELGSCLVRLRAIYVGKFQRKGCAEKIAREKITFRLSWWHKYTEWPKLYRFTSSITFLANKKVEWPKVAHCNSLVTFHAICF